MNISLENVGKKFGRLWVFRAIHATFSTGVPTAVLGGNGSGKSTLLRLIAGQMLPSEGEIRHGKLPIEDWFAGLCWVSPTLELIEEMTLKELLHFHRSFRSLSLSTPEIIEGLDLQTATHKQIRYFSSGMKQRLRLGLAFYDAQANVLLLDEPTTNLDKHYVNWYRRMLEEQSHNRLIIIASNVPEEYEEIAQQKIFLNKN
ncbi:MAG: ATP-binding cassette domain-containing protein [Bernardetiaceae bacterium]